MTSPVGVPAPGAVGVTVAVKVTDWPDTDGLAEEPTAVEVFALMTDCVKLVEVLPLKLSSPPYTAEMMWFETESDDVANVALLLVSNPVPSVVAPSLNVTVPDAKPAPGETTLTVAVNVTDWPKRANDGDVEVTPTAVLALLTVWPPAS